MRKFKYVLFALVTALAAAASFLLPPLVLRSVDRRLLREQKTVEMEPVDLALFSELTPVEKLRQMDAPQWVTLAGGRGLTAESAVSAAVTALADWLGIFVEGDAARCEAMLLMKDETSLLVWRVEFAPEDGTAATVWVDDETGMLLALEARGGARTEESPEQAPSMQEDNVEIVENVIKEFSEFSYGLGFRLEDYYGMYFDAYFMDAAMEMTREGMIIRLWDGDTGEYCDLPLTLNIDGASVALNR